MCEILLARQARAVLVSGKSTEMDLPTQIQERLDRLGVLPGDVEERFVRGAGPGGQKINKTSSTVVLRHGPSGCEVRCQEERSQAANRALAWERFCEKLEAMLREAEATRRAAAEKARRKARPKSRRQKAIQVREKRIRADVIAARRTPGAGED
jgi:peptide chain release factor